MATPSTLLEDEPLVLEVGGKVWEPQNVDQQFHGWVTARRALEDSINVATIRLGERVGWSRVVETARDLGIDAPLQPVPSLGLGSIEVAPLRPRHRLRHARERRLAHRAAPPARGARRLGPRRSKARRWRGRVR